MPTTPKPIIWLLIDDRPGNATQVRGVAEALVRLLGLPEGAVREKAISYTSFAKLPNVVRGSTLIGVTKETTSAIAGNAANPWPDLVIAAGRRTGPVARWIKKAASARGYKTKIAQIMNPGKVGAAEFDLIAIPKHDCEKPLHGRTEGDAPNVMRMMGAPHRFSAQRLAVETDHWAQLLSALPHPYIALFVGGATKSKPFPPKLAADLGARVNAMARELGGAVLLTTSRRTGPEAEAALQAAITEPHYLYIWSQQGKSGAPNPYAGYLAMADVLVVTGDSVSMCSEACANPGPVYIYAPAGMVTKKHARLHHDLYASGYARAFDGTYDSWRHAPLNAAGDVAARIAELLAQA
ncbi:MAG: mitochondrial fission ELM1 family protein [Rhodospirillaceae bacterium]|nr:mitochondrial fission ELM1 family protein [Rhodospirillaceae bacterium]